MIAILRIIAGIILLCVGGWMVTGYFVTAIPALSADDKSLIFWYLPFLIFGLPLVISGISLVILSLKSKSKKQS